MKTKSGINGIMLSFCQKKKDATQNGEVSSCSYFHIEKNYFNL